MKKDKNYYLYKNLLDHYSKLLELNN